MEIHEILTNMSVLFGIYRFGIAGIFYGPLIIILYKFIEKELLMKELRSKNRQPRESTFISSISKWFHLFICFYLISRSTPSMGQISA